MLTIGGAKREQGKKSKTTAQNMVILSVLYSIMSYHACEAFVLKRKLYSLDRER